MIDKTADFYKTLADYYHLIFEDWESSIKRQAAALGPLLAREISGSCLKILDCACGIGTQAIGLAALGHQVVASDISRAAVDRAEQEAYSRSLKIAFHVSDMTSLDEIPDSNFDAVITMDNALPHLDVDQLKQASHAILSKLKPGGLFLASIRDYDELILQKPAIQQPAFYGEEGKRRIVHQVWDWLDDTRYVVHLYITVESPTGWEPYHFVSDYRCLPRKELSTVLAVAGFQDIHWLMPNESRFYQPIVLARRSDSPAK